MGMDTLNGSAGSDSSYGATKLTSGGASNPLRYSDFVDGGYDLIYWEKVGTGFEVYLEDQQEGSIVLLEFDDTVELTSFYTLLVYD